MSNPFEARALPLGGPASDIRPITPDDGTDMPDVAAALYVETGGTVVLITAAGAERSVSLPDFTLLPVGVRRVKATGTTASGLHALVLA